MALPPALAAELVEIVTRRAQRARVLVTGTSMEPLLRAGMVIDIEPFTAPARVGEILVFKSKRGLIAHRYVGGGIFGLASHNIMLAQRLRDAATGAFITAGDAHPHRTEIVAPHLVVGRVRAVWSSADPDARRIDDASFARRGSLFARTRLPRALAAQARAYLKAFVSLVVADPGRGAQVPIFAVLVAATHAFERRDFARGVALLTSIPRENALEMARRHHASGLLSGWLDAAAEAGVAVPADLRETVRRLRWVNALQAKRVLACVDDVRKHFTDAAIPHIFLKGGARLAADASGADRQFSGDVDVLVPSELADRAVEVLHRAGYLDISAGTWYSRLREVMHHREPLRSPRIGVPVEVHQRLVPAPLVSGRLDYAALAPFARHVHGPIGEVTVLDPVLSAVHLAYHARDLQVWRDIVLLSRALRAFDPAARARFDAFVKHEKRDGRRLSSAVAAADAIVSDGVPQTRAVRRYLAWAAVREDLPRGYAFPELVEAVIGRCHMLGLRREFHLTTATWLRCWIRNLALLPAIIRFTLGRRSRNGRV